MDIQDFYLLFRGNPRGHGQYNIQGKVVEGKKAKGRAFTKKGEATEEDYKNHLEGKQGLGIVPILEDSTCWWGAIDIDVYDLDIVALDKRIKELSLPLITCRTKSGGAHLYLFARDEPIKAPILREQLLIFAQALGYPKAEIFPKQDKIDRDTDIGNWINLPYFDAENTARYALMADKALSLTEFLDAADIMRITEAELLKTEPETFTEDDLDGAPPCIQALCKRDIPLGEKNTTAFNVGVYCRLKYGDNWEEEFERMNKEYTKASPQTMSKSISQHRKKEYFYQCGETLLKEVCNKEMCRTRRFGIGQDTGPSILLGALQKVKSDPPIWYLDVEGEMLELSSEDLIDQMRFRKKCMEKIHKIPRKMKQEIWDQVIQERLDNVEEIEAPEDAGPIGQLIYLIRTFCTERAPAQTRDEILQHKPFHENGLTFFQSPDLMKFLQQNRFTGMHPNKIYDTIRKMGGEPQKLSVKNIKVRVWAIPRFEEQTEDFDVPEIKDDDF